MSSSLVGVGWHQATTTAAARTVRRQERRSWAKPTGSASQRGGLAQRGAREWRAARCAMGTVVKPEQEGGRGRRSWCEQVQHLDRKGKTPAGVQRCCLKVEHKDLWWDCLLLAKILGLNQCFKTGGMYMYIYCVSCSLTCTCNFNSKGAINKMLTFWHLSTQRNYANWAK